MGYPRQRTAMLVTGNPSSLKISEEKRRRAASGIAVVLQWRHLWLKPMNIHDNSLASRYCSKHHLCVKICHTLKKKRKKKFSCLPGQRRVVGEGQQWVPLFPPGCLSGFLIHICCSQEVCSFFYLPDSSEMFITSTEHARISIRQPLQSGQACSWNTNIRESHRVKMIISSMRAITAASIIVCDY